MRLIIERLIRFFNRIGIFNSITKIVYIGQGVSMNLFYSQDNWYKRKATKDKYGKIFDDLIEKCDIEWMNEFMVIMFYNSRHDPDNVVGLEKILLDSLKMKKDSDGNVTKRGYVLDDHKKYYKGFAIFPDLALEHNTFEFYIIKLK